jgi:AcrR family transcriptional regulator
MGNKSLTKLKILNASIEEFAAKGYENASTNAIASAAGVSKGAIFLHYKNKEGLFEACLSKVIENYKHQIQSLDLNSAKDLFDRLEIFLKWKTNSYAFDPISAQFLAACYSLKDEVMKARLLQTVNSFASPNIT